MKLRFRKFDTIATLSLSKLKKEKEREKKNLFKNFPSRTHINKRSQLIKRLYWVTLFPATRLFYTTTILSSLKLSLSHTLSLSLTFPGQNRFQSITYSLLLLTTLKNRSLPKYPLSNVYVIALDSLYLSFSSYTAAAKVKYKSNLTAIHPIYFLFVWKWYGIYFLVFN